MRIKIQEEKGNIYKKCIKKEFSVRGLRFGSRETIPLQVGFWKESGAEQGGKDYFRDAWNSPSSNISIKVKRQ